MSTDGTYPSSSPWAALCAVPDRSAILAPGLAVVIVIVVVIATVVLALSGAAAAAAGAAAAVGGAGLAGVEIVRRLRAMTDSASGEVL